MLTLVAVFKLLKAALLIALGLAGIFGRQQELARTASHLLAWVGALPGRHAATHFLVRVAALDHRKAELWGVLAFCYAAIFLVEGIGLFRHKRWAEWLTVVVTASFIPVEIYELIKHGGYGKLLALSLNIAILLYLVVRRIRRS